MRVPLSWLRDYVDFDLAPETLAERLTLLGMEVQSIERWGSDWQNVVIGELLTVEKHPRADRLSLTTVTTGQGEPLEIVCGATNIAPGQRVPVALPGAVLPGGRRIDRTEKMGVVSNGMLCSGDELNLTGDADGILILPAEAPLGMPLTDYYGDVVLDIDVKPNRGDALSLVGLAREVAAIDGRPIRFPETDPPEDPDEITEDRLHARVEDASLCPRLVGRWIVGVSIAASPDRVQMRLRAAGQRPVSNVVDASNYVMLELGKPVHTFDAAAVSRDGTGQARLVVRRAHSGERLETLDHVARELDGDTLVIADDDHVLAIAGIMGGASSEVSQSTRAVIVESAIFDPISIRRTAKRYGLRSEASLRFEKGQEFRLARLGADRAARLIAEWAGGSVASGSVDTNPNEPTPTHVAFRPDRMNRLLGVMLPADEQRLLLARVGIESESAPATAIVTVSADPQPLSVPAGNSQALIAIVPTWRRDIAIEADLAEEIARVHGYELIPSVLPHTPMPPYRHSSLEVRDSIRETLVGAGLTEVVTHALVSPRMAEAFRWESVMPPVEGGSPEGGRLVTLTNPLSSEHSVLRPAVVGSLVEVVSSNLRQGNADVTIYEIGKGYGYESRLGAAGASVREWWRLALAGTGAAEAPAWDRPARSYDLGDAKGAIELIARRLRIDDLDYEPLTGEPLLHPGRAARVLGRRRDHADRLALAGWVGELHPAIAEEWDLRGARVVVAELDVSGLGGGLMSAVLAAAPSRHPAAERDLAVVVDEARAAREVATSIRAHGGAALESVRLFDIYRGAPLAAGEKSLAFRLTFRAPDRTLGEAEVDTAIEKIDRAIASEVSGRIRT